MAKFFNVTANCNPNIHYMVDITEKLVEIKKMIDAGQYFTINRARQYGKTTTLHKLKTFLANDYVVVSLYFQRLGYASFETEQIFSKAFSKLFLRELKRNELSREEDLQASILQLSKEIKKQKSSLNLLELFDYLSEICENSQKPIVLMIDEVDSASNNQVFLDFLAQLRADYIEKDVRATFHSVILAGVYDVKNLERKIRADEEHKINSPWNIAADFNIDLSFSKKEIITMLQEYEEDYCTGMDIDYISELLYDYTSGYPFLVSRLCKLMDEVIFGNDNFKTKELVWTKEGFLEAVKLVLMEKNALFDSLFSKLVNYPELNIMIEEVLFTGKAISYNVHNMTMEMATMFGFIKNRNGIVTIANRIFETCLYNYYLSTFPMQSKDIYKASICDKNQFVTNGQLNVRLILERFVVHFNDLYGDKNETFLEEEGRKYFLLYLRPIINGVGNYYIEDRTRDLKRTDVIVDYGGEQSIIELKIWHGNEYNSRGEQQLYAYLEYYHKDKGYLLSFNFNKNKQIGVKEVQIGDKTIIEAVV